MKRRDFVKLGAVIPEAALATAASAATRIPVTIMRNFDPAAGWAIEELRAALRARRINNALLVSGTGHPQPGAYQWFITFTRRRMQPGALAIETKGNTIVIASADVQGAAWAILDLADRIRDLEMPKTRPQGDFFALSSGSRSFLRYGYGDLLKEKRDYQVLHRLWPGTQRLLLQGDPLMAAAYSRASSFCGSDGMEICEPLSFRGRKGSGLPGGRTGYADASLVPARDWQKYSWTYRVWGRHLYNPDTEEEVMLREPIHPDFQRALASSSRILPLITTAHMPSAANAIYWPEIYTNQSIVVENAQDAYSDTPAPKCFGTVSPLDPGLFAGVEEYVRNLIDVRPTAQYSPIEVATWLESLAAESAGRKPENVAERRVEIDAAIQNGIGRFFAAKFRAAVLFSLYQHTGDPNAKEQAVTQYVKARAAWQTIVDTAQGVYRDDLTFGYAPYLRGNWSDRMAAIDRDIAAMRASKSAASSSSFSAAPRFVPEAIAYALSNHTRPEPEVLHNAVAHFKPGQPVAIAIKAKSPVTLRYRRVNQAELWQSVEMKEGKAEIPAAYTKTEYPLQYYFEVGDLLHPGLPRHFQHAPYFVIRQA